MVSPLTSCGIINIIYHILLPQRVAGARDYKGASSLLEFFFEIYVF
jgi:hypothetical protein